MEIKSIFFHIRKEEIKQFPFIYDILVYLENPKESTKQTNILELRNEFSKVTGYKINIQKFIEFLYISNEHLDRKNFFNSISCTISQKSKYLGIHLTIDSICMLKTTKC